MRALWMLPLVVTSACAALPSVRTAPRGGLWVLAPHPDDESLMAAHVIATAVDEGRDVHVLIMTNGDLGCERDGWLRQRETVAAMAELGLPEERIRFLGYPDGHLRSLGATPLLPLARRSEDGGCGEGHATYGARGERGMDVHRARTGVPGPYVLTSVIDDLVWLLERDRPTDVYVSHPIDDHPDHATTYVLLRRALDRASLDVLPTLHRAIVHAGGCWPNGNAPREPCPEPNAHGTAYPPLPPPLEGYVPNERVPVPDGGARARRAIARHRSQLHTDVERDWLGTFARAEAVYYRETLVREGGRVVRAGGGPVEGAYTVVVVGPREAEVRAGDRIVSRLPRAAGVAGGWTVRARNRPDEGVVELEIRHDGEMAAVVIDPVPARGSVATRSTRGPT